MSYKAYYPMLIGVQGLIDAAGADLTAEKAAAALRAMADEIEANPQMLRQTFGSSPLSFEREDRWVLRAADKPNVMRKADGGWVIVDSSDIDLGDSLTSKQVVELSYARDEHSVWVRPEDIGGLPVLAVLREADGGFLGQVDLREWMAWTDEEEVAAAFQAGWDFTPAMVMSDLDGDPLKDDANILAAQMRATSFTMKIEEGERERAMRYLEELRPGFSERLDALRGDGTLTP